MDAAGHGNERHSERAAVVGGGDFDVDVDAPCFVVVVDDAAGPGHERRGGLGAAAAVVSVAVGCPHELVAVVAVRFHLAVDAAVAVLEVFRLVELKSITEYKKGFLYRMH